MSSTGIPDEVGRWCPSLDTTGNDTTTVYDLSDNSNNASLLNMTGAAWEASTGSGGVRGIRHSDDSHIADLGHKAIPSNDFTISIWANSVVVGGDSGQELISDSATGGVLIFASSPFGGATVESQFYGGGGVVTGPDIRGTGWRHLCGVRSGTNGYFYVDSQLVGSVSGLDPSNNGTGTKTTIGARETGVRHLKGLWDDCTIFNRALNTDEIALLASKRGYQPSLGIKRRRISSGLINSGLIR